MSNLSSSPSSLTFTATSPTNPSSQNVTISWSGGSPSIPYTTSSDQAWLSAAPGSGSTPDVQAVSVNITGLTPGVYTGHITATPTPTQPAFTGNEVHHFTSFGGASTFITTALPILPNQLIVLSWANHDTNGNFADLPASITDTQGLVWTLAVVNTSGDSTVALYWAETGAATGTTVITATASPAVNFSGISAMAFSTALANSPVDATAAGQGTGTSVTTGSLTTSKANELILAILSQNQTVNVNAGSGFTIIDDTSYFSFSEYKAIGPAGGYAATATLNNSANWNIAAMSIFGSFGAGVTSPLNPVVIPVTLTVNAGATGNIVIAKVTSPGGSSQSFTFTPSYGSPFSLTDGQSNNSGPLTAGTYSVSETPVAGWDTSTSSNPAAIVVTAGFTTTVTFTNTKRGNIVVQKVTSPSGSSQSFAFTSNYGSPFSLTDGQSNNTQIAPGTYSVAETAVGGWTTSTSQDPSAIVVTAGATTTVTFTNTQTPTPPPTPTGRAECTFVSTSPAELQPSDDRPTLPAPAGPQTWVYDFGTRGWFQLQRGFTSLAVFEIGEGELILVGGAEDGFVYVIDDLNGTFNFSGTCPVASFRPALIDFGDPSSMRIFKYLELEFTSDALAQDITVTYWLDPPNVDNPGTGKTMTLTKVRGADRWRGWPTGGALCQRLLIDITAKASTNTGAIRGAKIVADKIRGLTT